SYPKLALPIYPVAAVRPKMLEAGEEQAALRIRGSPPRTLGIYLNSGYQDFATEQDVAFLDGHRFEIEFHGFLDIGHRLFERLPNSLIRTDKNNSRCALAQPGGRSETTRSSAPASGSFTTRAGDRMDRRYPVRDIGAVVYQPNYAHRDSASGLPRQLIPPHHRIVADRRQSGSDVPL